MFLYVALLVFIVASPSARAVNTHKMIRVPLDKAPSARQSIADSPAGEAFEAGKQATSQKPGVLLEAGDEVATQKPGGQLEAGDEVATQKPGGLLEAGDEDATQKPGGQLEAGNEAPSQKPGEVLEAGDKAPSQKPGEPLDVGHKATTQEPAPCITIVKPADDVVGSKKSRKRRGLPPKLDTKHSHALTSGSRKGDMPGGVEPRFGGQDDDNDVHSGHHEHSNVEATSESTIDVRSTTTPRDLFDILKSSTGMTLELTTAILDSTTAILDSTTAILDSTTALDDLKSSTPCTVIVTATTPSSATADQTLADDETAHGSGNHDEARHGSVIHDEPAPEAPPIINPQSGGQAPIDRQLRKLEILDDIVQKGRVVEQLNQVLDKTMGGGAKDQGHGAETTMPPAPIPETEPLEASGLKYNLGDDDDD